MLDISLWAKRKWGNLVSAASSLPPLLFITWGVLMVAGIIVRWYIIVHAGSWWFDESLSYSFAKLPIFQSWHVFKYENNPPLYFGLLRCWGLLFGFGEIPLRFFSLILGVLATVVIMRLASELFGRATGMWAGAIYAVTSLAIFSDTEARMYSLLALLVALAWFYFLKLFYREPKWWEVSIYIFAMTLALYTSVTALWLPLTQAVVVAVIKPSHWPRIKVLLAVVVSVLLFVPWLSLFVFERAAFAKYISTGSWRYFSSGIPWFVIFSESASFFNFWGIASLTAEGVSLVVGLVFAGWFLHHTWKRHRLEESKHLVVLLGFLIPLIISALTVDLGASRYYYQSAVFFWIIIAYAVAHAVERMHSQVFLLGLSAAGLLGYAIFNLQLAVRYDVHGNWDVAARWIDAQRPDLVLAMPKMWSAEVYDPSLSYCFLQPPVALSQNAGILSDLQVVTRYNYNWGSLAYRMTPSQETILKKEIDEATSHASRVVFGYQGSEAEQSILAELGRLGFQRDSSFDVNGYLPETLVSFSRNSLH